jgi:hypothetical protein
MTRALCAPMNESTSERARAEKMARERRRQDNAVRRLAIRRQKNGQPMPIAWLDYRWWEAKRAGVDPDAYDWLPIDGSNWSRKILVFDWWKALHYTIRRELVKLSRGRFQRQAKK